MGWHGYLALWCIVLGAVALVGYGRSLAGVTRGQRAVRVMGRIERVTEPRHGSSGREGIAVVVTFRDPATGQEFTVTNDGECGDRISTAWTGREIGIRYPPGRPHAYRFTTDPDAGRSGLGWPNFAVFLIYVGLVVVASIDWGWPWALIGFGVPWTLLGATYLPGAIRDSRLRIEGLASGGPVPGRVIAVLKDVTVEEDGETATSHTPVVAFTTHDGTAVTAYRTVGLSDPARSRGRDLTIHYRPDNPVVFTSDLAAEHRSHVGEIAFAVGALLVGVAAAVAGGILIVG
ncbi:DUF3592 domain-containing protein [Streptomyces sp. NPDC050529]|uniref:DUF3592 domain-containing protein n=1 Tax=unclassified Streptomyces TaxID=2593676 RepID=UPI002DDA4B44|nr:DUF3592 domain-containing protein [Streptomyces sp. NBC_01022]WRZ78776.1 DUF3592 domain-containing protein [Streptomyces sp. NBC_01022]WRZ86903.1 DUF3592 domain-containing protein [Streptomyces sp. NBC_01022]